MKKVELSQGKVALVDDADFAAVSQFTWCAHKAHKRPGKWYAHTNVKREDGTRTTLTMHHAVLPGVSQIDHRNNDGLDNRRSNLRPATHAQNARNRRKPRHGRNPFKGVYPLPSGKWRVCICVSGQQHGLGVFSSPETAAHVYDSAARKFFGDFAKVNFDR